MTMAAGIRLPRTYNSIHTQMNFHNCKSSPAKSRGAEFFLFTSKFRQQVNNQGKDSDYYEDTNHAHPHDVNGLQ